MLALSGLCGGFARGWACPHTACPERCRREHLPVPKIPAAKPCISITSNLIQIKRLQVLHFGHLRKTGGEGSSLLALLYTRHPLPVDAKQGPPAAISFVSPTYEILTRNSIISPTYAKTGEYTLLQKCRRADIFDFSPYFSQFCRPEIDSRKRRPRSKTSTSLVDSDYPAGSHPDDGASIAPRVRCAT